jgi:hypothetical protein
MLEALVVTDGVLFAVRLRVFLRLLVVVALFDEVFQVRSAKGVDMRLPESDGGAEEAGGEVSLLGNTRERKGRTSEERKACPSGHG